jgi:putative ABC transport system permease protein
MGWSRFFRRRYWDEERARELEAYLTIETDENVARGMSPEAARAAAMRKLGNPTLIREDIYTMNSLGFIETLWQDVRYGARLLRRNPTFAVVAILTLALGTGANTAIFELVNAVTLRTLPVDRPEQLAEVRIVKTREGRTGSFMGSRPSLSNPLWERIRAEQRVFSSMLAWGSTRWNLSTGGEVRQARGLYVSGEFFSTLGVRALVGRALTPADDVKGCAAPGAVLSHAFWQREYGGAPSAIGRSILLDGQRLDIVGVTPPSFYGVDVGQSFDVALPICAEPLFRGERSGLKMSDVWFLAAFGRLKPGVTIEQASAQMEAISSGIFAATVSPHYDARLAKDYLEFKLGAQPAATGVSGLRSSYSDPLRILLGVTALVLLIACANLANLMIARATAREREIAVRLAIGASRGRILRQMLSESLLIAGLGAAAGLIVAGWFSAFLVGFLSTDSNPVSVDLASDWRVFAFTAGMAASACLVFGLTPAIRATRTAPISTMKAGSRNLTDSRERFGVRRMLVVMQVALSLVLVVVALLFVRSLRNLTHLDPGFQQDGVLVADVDYRKAGVPPDAVAALNRTVLERVRTIRGVDAAAQVFTTPVGGNFWNQNVVVAGVEQPGHVNFNAVGPGYFKALSTPLVAGRDFADRDTPTSPKVAIVSEAFVKKYLKGQNPVGQSFQIVEPVGEPRSFYTIIGVARDTKYTDLREEFSPLAYVDVWQGDRADPNPQFALHANTALPTVAAGVTRVLVELNPSITVQYQTVRSQVSGSLLRERLMATLSGFFGGLAVLIATVGLYGVMSYTVARRRVEIGIRMALGADRGSVIRMIVREAGTLLILGVAVGAALAMLAGRTATTLLYDVKPWDPVTVASAIALLGAVTLLASWLPARRASRLAPTVALREE